MKAVPALAALAFALWAAPAPGAEGGGMELVVSVGAGAYVPTQDNAFVFYDPAIFGTPGLAIDTLRPGVDLELAVSAWWGFLGAQVGVGYLSASWEQTSVDVLPVTALLRARLPLGSIAPYLEGGAGLCFGWATTPGLAVAGPYPPPMDSSSATTHEWIAGVGVDFDVGPVRLGASVRYLWIDRTALTSTSSIPLRYATPGMRFDLDGLTAAVSAGYRFVL